MTLAATPNATQRRRRLARNLLCAAALALLIGPLTGCEWRPVSVQLPTFFSAGIDELHFWRNEPQIQEFVRSGHMRFSSLIGPAGAQLIRYTMILPDGTESFTLTSPVEVQGDSIIVQLYFARWHDPGEFRVSARNAAGESDLSSSSIPL